MMSTLMAKAGPLARSSTAPATRPFSLPALARPAQRNTQVAGAAKLDKSNRLWELDTTWYPGADAPAYLDGTLAGDRGFDPLRLGSNPSTLPWLVEGELYNGRLAMLAVAGILLAEAAGKGPWWDAPFRADWPLPYWPGVVLVHLAMVVFEGSRYRNFMTKGETGLLNMVPFDPLNLRDDYKRQSEVRNGRLAMLAFLGFCSQAAVTGKGPLDNLADHLANPTKNNIFSSKVGPEVALAVCAISFAPIIFEARKSLTKDSGADSGFKPIPFL